jgi:hypothetical protein
VEAYRVSTCLLCVSPSPPPPPPLRSSYYGARGYYFPYYPPLTAAATGATNTASIPTYLLNTRLPRRQVLHLPPSRTRPTCDCSALAASPGRSSPSSPALACESGHRCANLPPSRYHSAHSTAAPPSESTATYLPTLHLSGSRSPRRPFACFDTRKNQTSPATSILFCQTKAKIRDDPDQKRQCRLSASPTRNSSAARPQSFFTTVVCIHMAPHVTMHSEVASAMALNSV